MNSRVLVALRIAAPRERVFTAFTREIHLWWRPHPMFLFSRRTGGTLAIEPELGGRFTETYADGTCFEIGRVTHWEPGARLALTWRQASFRQGQITEVDISFESVGAETRVTVEHRGWDNIPAAHVARHGMPDTLFLQRHGQYWQALLAAFRQEVEAQSDA
jgi:uncharacterized protein YndB with AHSA1/START domain